MSFRRVVLFVSMTALLFSTGCGMLNDPRDAAQEAELHSRGDDRESPESSQVPDGVSGTDEHTASGTDDQGQGPDGTTPSSSTTQPGLLQSPGGYGSAVDPSDLAALDRCMRIGAFVDAGDALFDAAVGRASLGRDVVEGILVALTNLEPIVLGDGRATLEEITGEAVPDIRDMLRDPDGVPVPDLRVLISGLAPRITILMGHLRTLCPTAISEGNTDTTQRVLLGQPLP